jgi:transposase
MDGSIRLSATDRKSALREFRTTTDPALRLRLHIVLLLDDGHCWATIAAVLFTSAHTINRWRRRFHAGGLAAVRGSRHSGRRRWESLWVALVVRWVTLRGPTEFGFVRSRWSCATVAILLRERWEVSVSRETVRRWLHQEGLVWRRPRPVLGPKDPARAAKLRKLRALLRSLPASEVAVFQDEVDINTNPKIGSMWMRRGQQAEVVTPGNNVKRYLAGSLNWRTGELILTESLPGQGRNAALFVAHLDELRRRLRRYRVIHVICDNARSHACAKVREYLQRWGQRLKIHYLPAYAPETNPIERVWWHLHEEITRNHRCQNIEELLDLVFEWLEAGSCFEIETSIYPTAAAIHATAA